MLLLCRQGIIRRVREQWGGVGGQRERERGKDRQLRKRQVHLSNCPINSFKGGGNDHESRKPQNTCRIAQSALHKYPWGIVDMFPAAVSLLPSWMEPLTDLLSSMNDEPLLLAWCVSHSAIILFGPHKCTLLPQMQSSGSKTLIEKIVTRWGLEVS